MRRWFVRSYEVGRKIVVLVVGATVVALGIVMLVLPGPAILVIPLGLAILGAEFAWARSWLRAVEERSRSAVARLRGLRTA